MTYSTILVSMDGAVGVISLNRPEHLNALTPEMADEIVDALTRFQNKGARAVLLTAEGKGFCSGTDISPEAVKAGDDAGLPLERAYHPMLNAILGSSLPMVAAVQGPCAGIGVSLALTADFVIAARNACFALAFTNIGLVPDGGLTWILPRLVGRARATQMMMLGDRIGAERAEQWGMIHSTVYDRELRAEAMALAQRLARGPTRAYGYIRTGVNLALGQSHADTLKMERIFQKLAGESEDFAEGLAAFREKRQPRFTGQ